VRTAVFTAIPNVPEIAAGDDLASIIAAALEAMPLELEAGDVLVIAQKIVSKAEGRHANLDSITPSERARAIAQITLKDPRLVELILSESTRVLRAQRNVLIVRHRLGFVMANAGIDLSNVRSESGGPRALLLPRDPDASAEELRTALRHLRGVEPGIIISDSFGRPWRNGVTNVALGAAGVPALVDRRGDPDLYGRPLQVTEVAWADAVAAAAGLMMGEAAEGSPVVLARGVTMRAPVRSANSLIRPLDEDLFQ
jgi:coenzyme F420-0:L-glutamate ligase/coenzyme F420-1:gamma-L-glutamate ligase